MTPTPQEHASVQEEVVPQEMHEGEKIVIAGMSGLYPMSEHIKKLSEILYDKRNPVTDTNRRWKYIHPEVGQHTGKAPGLDKFDAQFFKVHYRLAQNMDAMGKKILEQSYQAIYDAGVSPEQLSGKKVGVYIGSCFSETEKSCFYVANSRTGFGIAGCCKTMFANRVSYWLNAKGPSHAIDAACASSTVALEQAYLAMSRGECEAAIVGGANLCLHPQSSVHYGRITKICKDGKTKSYDENSDGIAKSEAVNVLFLQKAKDALRIYANLVHVKAKFIGILEGETGPRYGFYRNPDDMVEFIREFYEEAKVSPHLVEYVEGFGSAVPEADKTELDALTEVYCKNREGPLLIGSVMSNIGYGEAASGINAVNKVLLGYHTGKMAANLHLTTPRQDVQALCDGRMKIVTEHTSFNRGYTAVNGISVTGINTHVLLHGNYKPKDLNRYKSAIPNLVTVSARQDSAVKAILDDLKSRPIDPEEHALFHNIHKTRISGHLGRGYTVLSTNENGETISLAEESDYFDYAQKPLWYVYSGMGSQWTGMGVQLMRIPIFAAAIEKCHKVLSPKGVDIVHILTSPDKTIFNNILNSFVGIAAVQIGLTDILREIGLVPDKIIGHSVGELGCAYADGCFTAEEMILSAYSRGLVSIQTPFIKGSMAAVGIGYEQIKEMCPPEIEVACHNGPESSTISGPADKMKEFVGTLTEKGIFAKEVPCSNIAYHSRYIAEAGPGLLKFLSEVIKDPKARSDKWVSSSVPEERWGEESAKYSSAEYHTNNLLSPVLFEETSRLIPANAVVVEIAPHGLLQAIVKRSLPDSCVHVPLTRRGHVDNAAFLLEAIGKLYKDGFNPNVAVLYPKVSFPVSTGTPFLSHLVQWAHNEKWDLPLFVLAARKTSSTCKFIVSIYDNDYSYMRGNVIKDSMEFPFSAALIMAWDTLTMSIGATKKQVSVQYRDIQFFTPPFINDFRQTNIMVALNRGTGWFEVMDDASRVVTGYISAEISDTNDVYEKEFKSDEPLDYSSDDIYHMFYDRDHCYRDEFRSIKRSNGSFTEAGIAWTGNWVTLIDGMIQLSALRRDHNTVCQVKRIRKLVIDLDKQKEALAKLEDTKVLEAQVFEVHDQYRCGGIYMENVTFKHLPLIEKRSIDLQTFTFFPHFKSDGLDNATALQVQMQIVAENINKDVINVIAIKNNEGNFTAFNDFKSIMEKIPGVKIQYEEMIKEKVLQERDQFLTEADIVLLQNLSIDDKLCQTLYRVLRRDTFVLNAENTVGDTGRERPSALYRVVSSFSLDDHKLELSRWRPASVALSYSVVTITTDSDIVLLTRARENLPPRHKLLILTRYPASSTLKDLIKQWRKESDRNLIYLVEAKDEISEAQNLNVDLDLAFNILSKGIWGGEYYLPIKNNTSAQKQTVMLQSGRNGDIDSLEWVEIPATPSSGVNIKVHYAGFNTLDAKRAAGLIPFDKDDLANDAYYGMDFSGVTERYGKDDLANDAYYGMDFSGVTERYGKDDLANDAYYGMDFSGVTERYGKDDLANDAYYGMDFSGVTERYGKDDLANDAYYGMDFSGVTERYGKDDLANDAYYGMDFSGVTERYGKDDLANDAYYGMDFSGVTERYGKDDLANDAYYGMDFSGETERYGKDDLANDAYYGMDFSGVTERYGKDDLANDAYYGMDFSGVTERYGKDDLANDAYYGMDSSGVTESGERVMGVVKNGAMRGVVSASNALLWPVPEHWSLQDAATVPLSYAHAYYCLTVKSELKSHMNLLVHGGAGALGQAAIAIALSIGCEVYTTVSDIRKKRFLKRLFPNLKEEHIYNSRDSTFGDMLMTDTKTYGCDIVLSCVEGELKHLTLHCCAPNGFFLDTSQAKSVEDFKLGMFHLTKERNYLVVDFASIFREENFEELRHVQRLVSEGISRGWVRPLARVCYAAHEAARALRLLATSRHRGRVLLHLTNQLTAHLPRITCSPEQTQVVVFSDELGLHLAEKLISRGAKKILINGDVPLYYRPKIAYWESQGVQIVVSSENLANGSNVKVLFKKLTSLGHVENIFVVGVNITGNKSNELSTVAAKLSEESKKHSASLKHFTIVSSGKKFGQETVSTRLNERLPVTLVELPKVKKFNDEVQEASTSISWQRALDAIEAAMRSEQPMVLANRREEPKLTLFQKITRISDITVPEDIDGNTTLQELGVELVNCQIICAMLRDNLNITLVPDEIPHLTVQELKNLDETFLAKEYKHIQGLETFFSYVDPDELYASTEMLFLPTRTHCSTMRDDEFDVSQRYLCIVPGLEGNRERFRFMCESLKLQAMVLQPGLDKPQETIPEMAQRYATTLLTTANIQNNFYLLGYESGVLVALEIAAILEDQGYTGTIFCVGCGPEELKNVIRVNLKGVTTEDELQNVVIRHMYQLITGLELPEELSSKLLIPGWKQKIDNCMRAIRAHALYSTQYMRALIEAAYARIGNVLKYTVKPRALKSKMIFLQAADGGLTSAASLQQYSQLPIEIHHLSAPLAHAAKDCRCSAVLNGSLDEEVIELFEKKDLCETYLASTQTFMAHDFDLEVGLE